MAKVIEEVIIVKLSRIVKDSSKDTTVVGKDQRKLIEETLPSVVEEVLGDNGIIVEVADLE